MIQADMSPDTAQRIMLRAIDLILSWPDPGDSEQGAADDGAGTKSEQKKEGANVGDGAENQ